MQATLKRCFKCAVEKPLSEFYKHPMMGDGHLGKCKACARKDVNENRAKRIEYYRTYDRERGKTTERKRQLREKNRRKRSIAGPMYTRAHNMLTRAVWLGRVQRPSACQRCAGTGDIEAHHDDYSKPLDVMWLCPICHAARHRELGRLRTVAKMYGDNLKLGF